MVAWGWMWVLPLGKYHIDEMNSDCGIILLPEVNESSNVVTMWVNATKEPGVSVSNMSIGPAGSHVFHVPSLEFSRYLGSHD